MSTIRFVLLFAVVGSALRVNAADIFNNPTADDVSQLIACLDDPNLRLGASQALISLKAVGISELEQALDAASLDVRIWAAYTLGKIGPAADPAIGRLADTVNDANDPNERLAGARSMGQIVTARSKAKSLAVNALARGLSDSADRVRIQSAVSLGKLAPLSDQAIRKLIESFADKSVRATAAASVIVIGKPAIPHLVAALDDDLLRLDAARALRKLDATAARKSGVDQPSARDLPALKLAIQDEAHADGFRVSAAHELGEVGIKGAPMLIASFASTNETVSRAAVAAFRRVGPNAISLLTKSLQDESALVRAKAADAIGAIGPEAMEAVPDLVSSLNDTDRTVQHRVVVALERLGKGASDAVPALIEVMQNPRMLEPTRQLALKVLVRAFTDKQRPSVIAALKQSSTDTNFGIKSLALSWLRKLEATHSSTP